MEISDDEINSSLKEFNALPTATPQPKAKPQKTVLSDEELQAELNSGKPPEGPGFWSGVGTAIAGHAKKVVKGVQLQGVEATEDDANLRSYYRDLGEARRRGDTKKIAEFEGLIKEAQKRQEQHLSAPQIAAQVQKLQSNIQEINEDIAGARPQDMGFWKSAAFDAATSVGIMAPSLALGVATGGSSIPLTTIGLTTFASSYADHRAEGRSRDRSARLASIDGLVEAGTELLPTSRLLKNTGVFRKFLESTIADIPGEQLANYVQNATQEMGKLPENATDAQVKEALLAAVPSAGDAASVAASTVIAGGAISGAVAGTQTLLGGGSRETDNQPPIPKQEGTKVPEAVPPITPPTPNEKRKPHFKSPAEAQAAQAKPAKPHFKSPAAAVEAAKAATPPGSEFADLEELLETAKKEAGDAKAEIVDFGKAKEKRTPFTQETYLTQKRDLDAEWVAGDISSEEHTKRDKELTEKLNATRDPKEWQSTYKIRAADRLSNMQIRMDENRPGLKTYHKAVEKLDKEFDEGGMEKGDYVLRLTKLQRELEASMGRERDAERRRGNMRDSARPPTKPEWTAEEFDAEMDRRIAEMKQADTAADSTMTDDDLLALYHDTGRRQRVAEFSGPAPIQPRLTGDRMEDRRLQTRFMRKLREWAGEMEPAKKGTVSELKPAKSVTPTDKVSSKANAMVRSLTTLHDTSAGMWEVIRERSEAVAKRVKSEGIDPSAATVVSADQVLAQLEKNAKGPYREMIGKIRESLPEDQTIHFQYAPEGITLPNGQKEDKEVGGLYIPRGRDSVTAGRVYIRVEDDFLSDPSFTRTVLHELVHAATYDYMIENPDSELTKRVEQLWVRSVRATESLIQELEAAGYSLEAIEKSLGGMITLTKRKGGVEIETKNHLYGLTNQFEIIAEAYANPVFMANLAKASPRAKTLWSRIQQIFHETVGTVAEMLGFNKRDAGLLHELFDATEDLMWASKHLPKPKQRKPVKRHSSVRSAPIKNSPYGKERQLKTKTSLTNAMQLLTKAADKVPGLAAVRGKVDQYMQELKRNIAPETLGPKATQSAALLSKWIVNQMRNDASYQHQSQTRRDFWEKNAAHATEFIRVFESGWIPKDPEFREVALAYQEWNKRIAAEDAKQGIEYQAKDNYLYHVFAKHEELASYMQRKYGRKWGDPGFMKDRAYDLYEEAVKAGFKPLYTNPEDIMLARQHASEIAHMKIGALKEMWDAGLAWEKAPKNVETVPWRSPNGDWFYVHHEAAAVLHNAWNTESMWAREGLAGDVFRGAMYLKNRIVPIKLSLSLFHFLHVLTINNATGMLRATKGLLLGNVSPGKWLKEMGKAAAYTDLISSPRFGGRIRAVFRGEIPPSEILPHEALAIQYMIEGGMLPEQSHQYKSNAKTAFRNAVLRSRKQPWALGRAAYELPFAALDWMQHWMFEKWIPSIKTTSYLNEVKTALESDPSLVHDQQRRQIVFHRLAKSVDNRHGEMVYKTMFWNKWIKDTAVVNLLSLGWQMGFIREYGGGIGDLAKIATTQGDMPTKIKAGLLDRPIFVAFYTTQALMYGGLLTWAMTGEPPEEWKDYIYPSIGVDKETKEKERVNTMFYPREFAAIAKHIEQEGVVGGMTHTIANKASGVYGLIAQSLKGVDDFGAEFVDPHGSAFEKLEQRMDFVLSEMTPISVGGLKREGVTTKSLITNVTGFSGAPAYATRSKTDTAIRQTWQKYNAKTQTSFEKALYSKDMRDLRKFREDGEDEKFQAKFDEMVLTHKLTGKERQRLYQSLRRKVTPEQSMFRNLTWQQQKRLLDAMTPEEREIYLPHSNRTHLRFRYEEE